MSTPMLREAYGPDEAHAALDVASSDAAMDEALLYWLDKKGGDEKALNDMIRRVTSRFRIVGAMRLEIAALPPAF